jgi:hypothetical protein
VDAEIVRIDFLERDEVWEVTLWLSDGTTRPGEPFPASGHPNYSKLEQVTRRLQELGYRATRMPYSKVNETRYNLEVVPITAAE